AGVHQMDHEKLGLTRGTGVGSLSRPLFAGETIKDRITRERPEAYAFARRTMLQAVRTDRHGRVPKRLLTPVNTLGRGRWQRQRRIGARSNRETVKTAGSFRGGAVLTRKPSRGMPADVDGCPIRPGRLQRIRPCFPRLLDPDVAKTSFSKRAC